MELQPGFHIKMLTAIKAKGIIIPKGDVVKVVEVGKKGIVIEDILDNLVILPKNAKFKVISTKKAKAKLVGAVIPTGELYRSEIAGLGKNRASAFRQRSLQMAQVVTSTALTSDDPILLSKLAIASNMLTMTMIPGIDSNSMSRLYQFARKLGSA